MASSVPPVKNAAFTAYVALVSQADTDIFKTSVTLAAGDVKVSKDGGAFANVSTLPTEIGTSGVLSCPLSSDEMNADVVVVKFTDAAGSEWQDALVTIYTAGQTLDTTDGVADTIKTKTDYLPSAAAGASGGLPVLDANLVSAANVTLWKDATAPAMTGDAYAVLTNATYGLDKLARTGADADTLETLSDQLDAMEPTDVWAYTSRTLTALPSATTDGTTAGSITRRRGDSWSIALTALGAITGYTSVWMTVKGATTDADSAAILQVKKNASLTGDGLLYVNGVAATDATKASITIVDASTGAITIAVDESITDDMAPGTYSYDVQALVSGTVMTLDTGTFTVTADVTRSIT